MMKKPYKIIKVGGNELADIEFMNKLIKSIQKLQKDHSCILVHGGGVAINQLLTQTGIIPKYKNGQRITDEATLEIAEMVLSGKINKQLVLALNLAGIDAIGISGIDRNFLQVEPWGEAMDLVGKIVKVRTEVIESFCKDNILPVISPISIGKSGRYNVNADHAAGMVAGALEADEIIFITNVAGVLKNNKLLLELTDFQIKNLIEEEVIFGGMIPKVNSALDALNFGAKQTIITNIAGLEKQSGTKITTSKDSK